MGVARSKSQRAKSSKHNALRPGEAKALVTAKRAERLIATGRLPEDSQDELRQLLDQMYGVLIEVASSLNPGRHASARVTAACRLVELLLARMTASADEEDLAGWQEWQEAQAREPKR